MDKAIEEMLADTPAAERDPLRKEFDGFRTAMGGFKFSMTKPYWNQKEAKQVGTGGLFAITVNPFTCKGCMLCVDVCEDEALTVAPQTETSVA